MHLELVYVGLVIGLQTLLSSIISHDSGVAIVISTLAIAALFQPFRHRLQQVIDRRYYRRKYNAAQTLAAFGTTLRHEMDLDQLREALLVVVQETMQPAHVSLWVRPLEPSRQQNTRLLPRIEEEESRAARRRENTVALPAGTAPGALVDGSTDPHRRPGS